MMQVNVRLCRKKEMRYSLRSRYASRYPWSMTPSFHAPKMPAGIDTAATAWNQPAPVPEVRDDPRDESNEFQRIDRPHAEATQTIAKAPVPKAPLAENAVSEPIGRKTAVPSDPPLEAATARQFDPLLESWLRLHATDLIDRLSQWSDDLDAREAGLNARIAKQDLRERQFRLQQQFAQMEMDEQQRAIDRLRNQIQDHARRLAFQDA